MNDEKKLELASFLWQLHEPKIAAALQSVGTNREDAMWLLSVASGLIKADIKLPDGLREWVAIGLSNLALGLPEHEAFCFPKRKRGQREEGTNVRVERDWQRLAYLTEFYRVSNGATVEEARRLVAKQENVSEDVVKTGWEKYHQQAKMILALSGFSNDDLNGMTNNN